VGSLPRIGEYFPGKLFNWGAALVLGGDASGWPALWISFALMILFLATAWLILRMQEI